MCRSIKTLHNFAPPATAEEIRASALGASVGDAHAQSVEAIRAQGFDETFVRTWRLYLAYCEAGFDEGRTDVMQFVVASDR